MIHFQDRIKNDQQAESSPNLPPRSRLRRKVMKHPLFWTFAEDHWVRFWKRDMSSWYFPKLKLVHDTESGPIPAFVYMQLVRSNSQKTHRYDASICNFKVLTILQPFDFRWSYSIDNPKVSDLASTLMEQTGSYVTWMVCVCCGVLNVVSFKLLDLCVCV